MQVSQVPFVTSPIYRTHSYAEWSGPNFEHGNTWLSGISHGCTWSHCHCSQLETLYPNLGLVFSSPLSCTNLHQPCFQHHHLCFHQHHPFSPPLPFFDPIEVCFIFIFFFLLSYYIQLNNMWKLQRDGCILVFLSPPVPTTHFHHCRPTNTCFILNSATTLFFWPPPHISTTSTWWACIMRPNNV